MKKFFKYLRHDKITYWGFLISFFLLLASFLTIGFFYQSLPPYLPLYNKMPWGYARIGQKFEIFIYLFSATVFFIINIISASRVYQKVALLARFLSISAVMIWLFVFIFVIQLIILMR